MDSAFCEKIKYLRLFIIIGTICTVILLSISSQDFNTESDIVSSDDVQSNIKLGTAHIKSDAGVTRIQLKWEQALGKLHNQSYKELNDSEAKQKIMSILDINKDEYESLFYKVDIDFEFQRSVIGNPFEPLSSFRSPCWISHYGSNYPYGQASTTSSTDQLVAERHQDKESLCLRCLPIVYLIGISKCGTTDLRGTFNRHPLIQMPGGEQKYWNRLRIGKLRLERYRFEAFHEYINTYNKIGQNLLKLSKLSDEQVPDLTLDSTPHYLWDYDGWQNIPGNQGLDEPRYILPHTLVKLVPNAKYIAIVRNPTNRLYSQFHMITPKGSPQLFHKMCEDAIGIWNACTARYTERACAYNGTLLPYEYTRGKGGITLRASMYFIFLKDWYDVLPRQNIFVIRGEDYYSNRTGVLTELVSFLDLPELPPELNDAVDHMHVKNASKDNKKRRTEPMLPETREMLDAFYKSSRNNLQKLLNDPKFLWND